MRIHLLAGTALAFTASTAAIAAPTFYMGGDDFATNVTEMPTAVATAATFDAIAPTLNRIDFEAATGGFSWSSGSVTNVAPVAGCAHRCGFNTTAGGSNYLHFGSGTITFTFASAINTFGAYVTGLQNSLVGGPVTLSFDDGSAQSTSLPGVEGGGGAFVGFTTTGAVTSLSFFTRSDIVGFDDILFGFVPQASSVPEPAVWSMMLLGFGGIGYALRRRTKVMRTVRYA